MTRVLALAAALMWGAEAQAQGGLLGEYYDTTALTQLADTRLDPVVDFSGWQGAPPGTAVASDDRYSERWSGFVLIEVAGTWSFSTSSNDGVRLWVAGQQLINHWTQHPSVTDTASLTLAAGWHPIVLEHFQDGGAVTIQLAFAGPGQAQAVIPPTHLSPVAVGNLFPTVDIGPDKVLALSSSPALAQVLLTGTADDQDGTIDRYGWFQLSGPPAILSGAATPTLLVAGLDSAGPRSFQLTVWDDDGAQTSDQIQVTVVDCAGGVSPAGTARVWNRLTFDFVGPNRSEASPVSPFRDARLTVTFTHAASGTQYRVPGFFAADGQAQDTGATVGNIWRARFTPDAPGSWFYEVSFRIGRDIAVSLDPLAGVPAFLDGITGCFQVAGASPSATGLLKTGRLVYVDDHFLSYAGNGRAHLQAGANSSENLLAYVGFDQTPASHGFGAHIQDWSAGDPTWKGGSGKGLIGAVNYLASVGINTMYFLTHNVGGDGDDVWPWTNASERLRYDVSKLAQWEVVFDHMDRMGIGMHVVTQEQENDNGPLGLDGGSLGLERKLYYRELIARFGHHLGVVWNLGEENSNSSNQRREFYDYITALDAYDHPVVVHSFPNQLSQVYDPMLTMGRLEGASLQVNQPEDVHDTVLFWRQRSAELNRPWFMGSDETGPAGTGVVPDSLDPSHDGPRKGALWGNLMAGGAGCQWYFGYDYPHHDLTCEDYRTRHQMWLQTKVAVDFFNQHVPYPLMAPADELLSSSDAWCLARPGSIYVVYLPEGGSTDLDLGSSNHGYSVRWFNPRSGGALSASLPVSGPGPVTLSAPSDAAADDDWVALVEVDNQPPQVLGVSLAPDPLPSRAPFVVSVSVSDPDGPVDIQFVFLHVWAPGGVYLGALPCAPAGPGQYEIAVSAGQTLASGTWGLAAQAFDASGLHHHSFGSFVAR